MSSCEIWLCDGCSAEQREDIGDGPPPGWAKNTEDDDFCPKCAKLLDPYDPDADESLSDNQCAALQGAMSDG